MFRTVKGAKLCFYPDAGILLASVELCPVVCVCYIKQPRTCLFALTKRRQVNSLCWKCFDLVHQRVSGEARGMGALFSLAEAAPASKSGKPWGEMFSVQQNIFLPANSQFRWICCVLLKVLQLPETDSKCVSGRERNSSCKACFCLLWMFHPWA